MPLTIKQAGAIEDHFFASGLLPVQMRCGLGLKPIGKSNILIKISTEHPNKHRPYLELLEELYLQAIKFGHIKEMKT